MLVAPPIEDVPVVVVVAMLRSILFFISALLNKVYSSVSFKFCWLKTDHGLLPNEPLF